MDIISIKNLEVFYRVGVPDEERERPQKLLITIDMEKDVRRAAETDDIAETIDYYAVSRQLLNFGEGRNWKLIEKLAADIAGMVVKDFGAAAATVEVKKFVLPVAEYVSVKVRR